MERDASEQSTACSMSVLHVIQYASISEGKGGFRQQPSTTECSAHMVNTHHSLIPAGDGMHCEIGKAANMQLCACRNIFWGIQVYAVLYPGHKEESYIAYGSWIGALVLIWLNLEMRAATIRDTLRYHMIQEGASPGHSSESFKHDSKHDSSAKAVAESASGAVMDDSRSGLRGRPAHIV